MIGIHDRPGSYSDRWIAYCRDNDLAVKRIDCLGTDVIKQCQEVPAVLWHWSHANPADKLVARQIVSALEHAGKIVFPSGATCWHYDDKLAQKYLLEAIDAPLVPTWVFTSKKEALRCISGMKWPKVFKLRCGAGSRNVRLVRSLGQAEALCRQAFGRGFPALPGYFADLTTRVRRTTTPAEFKHKLARAPKTLLNLLTRRRLMERQKGYVYFQEFLPGNCFDTRITVIGDRAFAFRRMNRPGDFRASGSGRLRYETELIDKRCVQIAFEVTRRIGAQSLAFDFLFDERNDPRICEMSYCYAASAVYDCPGYWDAKGNWYNGHVWPQDAIIEDILSEVSRKERPV